jgi:hypothetical protein
MGKETRTTLKWLMAGVVAVFVVYLADANLGEVLAAVLSGH